MFCNVRPGSRHSPVLIHSDAVFLVLIAVFALSNGYLTTTTIMLAPQLVPGHRAKAVQKHRWPLA